jgi:hypothetical protein
VAAAVNWVSAVYTDVVGPSWIIQFGVDILLVVSGVVAIRTGRESIKA